MKKTDYQGFEQNTRKISYFFNYFFIFDNQEFLY